MLYVYCPCCMPESVFAVGKAMCIGLSDIFHPKFPAIGYKYRDTTIFMSADSSNKSYAITNIVISTNIVLLNVIRES